MARQFPRAVKKYGVVHGLAECLTCGWETSSYKNAQALAARHAKVHGHHVKGELGIAFEYAETKEESRA